MKGQEYEYALRRRIIFFGRVLAAARRYQMDPTEGRRKEAEDLYKKVIEGGLQKQYMDFVRFEVNEWYK